MFNPARALRAVVAGSDKHRTVVDDDEVEDAAAVDGRLEEDGAVEDEGGSRPFRLDLSAGDGEDFTAASSALFL